MEIFLGLIVTVVKLVMELSGTRRADRYARCVVRRYQ